MVKNNSYKASSQFLVVSYAKTKIFREKFAHFRLILAFREIEKIGFRFNPSYFILTY
jgi:hypothetical protein